MTRKPFFTLFLPVLLTVLSSGCKKASLSAKGAIPPVNLSQVVVPEVYQMDQNTYEMVLPLGKDSGISLEDRVIFKRVGGGEQDFPIANVTAQNFLVQCDATLTTGFYTLFLEHKDHRYYLGQTTVDLRIPIEVNPDPGVNLYGVVLCNGVGIPGVVVSDGAETVLTDKDGIYQMTSEKKWKYVFVSVPSGYNPPLQGMMPKFFASLENSIDGIEQHI